MAENYLGMCEKYKEFHISWRLSEEHDLKERSWRPMDVLSVGKHKTNPPPPPDLVTSYIQGERVI